MPKLSAGLLLYRRAVDGVEVLIAHPGGPIWARRDAGAWSLPKGAALDHETSLLEAARREFREETGHWPPDGEVVDLGEVRMRSGKTVHGFAVEGDLDPDLLHSMQIEIEWPPRSGRVLLVPEIDRVLWANPIEARRRLNRAQATFVDRLLEVLARVPVPVPAPEQVDVAVIGAGIIGLATALRLLEARPDLRLAVLEGEDRIAAHQSGHNSGVVHAGLYYVPGSQKAVLCREGKGLLERYCEAHGIPIAFPGKLVVALDETELPRLAALRERGEANGVDGLEEIGPERIREIEPHIAGIRALWSPRTGITDFTLVTQAYARDVAARGGAIELRRPVTAIARRADGMVLSTPRGPLRAGAIIACAGLWSDRVAALTGDATPDSPRIVPFRGDFYTLSPDAAGLVNGLVYPVPDPRLPFLGVHFTRRIDGQVWAGPNAVLAFKRAGYRRRDISPRDLVETLANPGFRKLARRFWRTGLLEMWRDVSRDAFTRELQRYLPDIRPDQLRFGPSGVRAQAIGRDGSLVDDFDLTGTGRLIHVRNAPSPAATSSLAIGGRMAARALDQFGL